MIEQPLSRRWKYKGNKSIATGNYGGLRLRLLTSPQLGLPNLLFPSCVILIGIAVLELFLY